MNYDYVTGRERGPAICTLVRVPSVQQLVHPKGDKAACDEVLNMHMKRLFKIGARRFRVVPVPRTGDDQKFKIMAWRVRR